MFDTFTVKISDRNYTSYEVLDHAGQSVVMDITKYKLFNDEQFILQNNNAIIKHTNIRSGQTIAGVLILNGNKTYGRESNGRESNGRETNGRETNGRESNGRESNEREKKTNSKLLYKCVPYDNHLPSFLIPYEIKSVGFSKNIANIYVLFHFDNWDDKHPIAKLDNVIGPVNTLEHYFDYQIYCKHLFYSIQSFNKLAQNAVKSISHEELCSNIRHKYPSIDDRTDRRVITIDPLNCRDIDDGVGLEIIDESNQVLSIYIANVVVWMDVLNLWSAFTERVSTIYLPNKKIQMLPTILAEGLCSLLKNEKRIAFTMDIFIQNDDIINIEFKNAFINVSANYEYEEPALLSNKMYQHILNIVKNIAEKYEYIDSIKDSHDLITYLMIFMNNHCAKQLVKYDTGIFRATVPNKSKICVPEDVAKNIKIFNSSSGHYVNVSNDLRHEMLELDAYIHITSPIRRKVDILNLIQLQHKIGLITLSQDALTYYETHLAKLDFLNEKMKAIKKVQTDCALLHLCSENPAILEKEYIGYLFEKTVLNNDMYAYNVYLPELKLFSRIKGRENIDDFDMRTFKLFLFSNEDNIKRKIRIQMV